MKDANGGRRQLKKLDGRKEGGNLTDYVFVSSSDFAYFSTYSSVAGSPSSDALAKMIDLRQLEELRIEHDGD